MISLEEVKRQQLQRFLYEWGVPDGGSAVPRVAGGVPDGMALVLVPAAALPVPPTRHAEPEVAEAGVEEVGVEVGEAEVGEAEVGEAEVGEAEVGGAEVGEAEVGDETDVVAALTGAEEGIKEPDTDVASAEGGLCCTKGAAGRAANGGC